MSAVKSKTKITTEQLETLAAISMLVQDLQELTNPESLAKRYGTSRQLIHYYIKKSRKENK